MTALFLSLSLPLWGEMEQVDVIEGKNLGSFAKQNWFLEWSKTHPTLHTGRHLTPNAITPKFGFRHFYEPAWLAGVGAQFKSLKTLDDQQQLSYWTLFHEVSRVFRIYHPVYFSFGFKGLYLLPTKASKIPMERRNDFEVQIGAGLTASLHMHINRLLSIQISGDRWRGTKDNELHAYEVAAGVTYRLPFKEENKPHEQH